MAKILLILLHEIFIAFTKLVKYVKLTHLLAPSDNYGQIISNAWCIGRLDVHAACTPTLTYF